MLAADMEAKTGIGVGDTEFEGNCVCLFDSRWKIPEHVLVH